MWNVDIWNAVPSFDKDPHTHEKRQIDIQNAEKMHSAIKWQAKFLKSAEVILCGSKRNVMPEPRADCCSQQKQIHKLGK